ncbi:MAG: excinuclease ABC subunit UvrA [Sandaracinaceae bacterium]|nr:excinuclease ABC subunit UvrA [Sandaracinaceae bacterium]
MRDVVVRGARQHNLKSVDVRIPRDRLTVVTGPSGSGKSSLAFDTIYAEGQRRYVESLSAYARRFLDRMPKPDVDHVEGLSPAIAIQQRSASRNPRSTVGTITEIYDHLRLLYARAGRAHCPVCGRPIHAHTIPQMAARVLALPEGTRLVVAAPVARGVVGDHAELLERLRRDGYVRVEIDGAVAELAEVGALAPDRPHDIAVQIDRLTARASSRGRIHESLELAASLSDGLVWVQVAGGETLELNERLACPDHGPVLTELTPQTFSFNSPEGACPTCGGMGEQRVFDPDRVVPDSALSIAGGAIAPWGKAELPYYRAMTRKLTAEIEVNLDTAWRRLRKAKRAEIIDHVVEALERRSREYLAQRAQSEGETDKAIEYLEDELGRFARVVRCTECRGARLRKEALAVRVGGRSIDEITTMTIEAGRVVIDALELEGAEAEIAGRLLSEIRGRLGFLDDVGLGYLSLDRSAATLSGGEAQRVHLATQIGAALVGVLYVLDEPSIGLHPRDNARLLETLLRLRDVGNTLIVVEHDATTMRAADHLVDMGPGAGRLGGTIVATGSPEEVMAHPDSATGRYLREGGRPARLVRRKGRGVLRIEGATTHNLRAVDVEIPLGTLTCVTGVSGSGKSSLITDTLVPLARAALHGADVGEIDARLVGLEQLDKIVPVDQAAIGRTPRSNPATYSGLFTLIRELFASLPEARARGWGAGRFSFNVKGGRCEVCSGDGVLRVAMHFLPDVYVTCEECRGARYDRETLEVRYRGLSIRDVLALTVDDALDLFEVIPKMRQRLEALRLVGLGYVELGQSATSLSGGEAQRMKLAKELARTQTGSTLYVLDEPTTGLHFGDVEVLMGALDQLVEQGNTVLVIEHDLDVVGRADHVIDLGPEGGAGGGEVVVAGSPEQVAACEASHTGRFLRDWLR